MEVILNTLTSLFKPDERFITHRYYSSRLALAAGLISILIWFNYDLLANQRLRWDLAVIAGVMALTKLVAMLYYRSTR